MIRLLTALSVLLLAGCWRPAPPAQIGEGVRIIFTGNDGRLVRAQGYLAQELGQVLVTQLGWHVSPTGSAVLQIVLQEERLDATARNRDDVPTAQRLRLTGTALLTTRQGSITSPFTGEGLATGFGDEPEALQSAAKTCALMVGEWLAVAALSPP